VNRKGVLADVVCSPVFALFCLMVILSNAVFTTIAQDDELAYIRGEGPDPSGTILAVETGYLIWYVIELSLKLWVQRCLFFYGEAARWNIFDLVLVLVSVADLSSDWISKSLVEPGDPEDQKLPVSLRILRLFRVVRVLRTFKAVRLVEDLRLMMELILNSLSNIIYAMILVFIIVYIFAFVLVQGVVMHLKQTPEDLPLFGDFNGVGPSMLTLLKSVTGGVDWEEPFEIVRRLSWWYPYFFVVFVLFFLLVLLNIITSVFVDRVMKFAEPNPEAMVEEMRRVEIDDMNALEEMFMSVDADHDRCITYSEFLRCMGTKQFGMFLATRGIDVKEARAFFEVMCEEQDMSAEIDVRKMVESCAKMKGNATSVDLQILRHEVNQQYAVVNDKLNEMIQNQQHQHRLQGRTRQQRTAARTARTPLSSE
jgi:Ca2+-binding EF-hand superfamily protein